MDTHDIFHSIANGSIRSFPHTRLKWIWCCFSYENIICYEKMRNEKLIFNKKDFDAVYNKNCSQFVHLYTGSCWLPLFWLEIYWNLKIS